MILLILMNGSSYIGSAQRLEDWMSDKAWNTITKLERSSDVSCKDKGDYWKDPW